jgi:hypothetical protein
MKKRPARGAFLLSVAVAAMTGKSTAVVPGLSRRSVGRERALKNMPGSSPGMKARAPPPSERPLTSHSRHAGTSRCRSSLSLLDDEPFSDSVLWK